MSQSSLKFILIICFCNCSWEYGKMIRAFGWKTMIWVVEGTHIHGSLILFIIFPLSSLTIQWLCNSNILKSIVITENLHSIHYYYKDLSLKNQLSVVAYFLLKVKSCCNRIDIAISTCLAATGNGRSWLARRKKPSIFRKESMSVAVALDK